MSFRLKYEGDEINERLDKAGTALQKHQDISHLATKDELSDGLDKKQDIIEDLESIRENASKGATALQSVPSEYVTESELEEKGFLTEIPDEYVTASELEEKGYLTEHQSIEHLATKEELNSKQDVIDDLEFIRDGASKGNTALQSVPEEYVTEQELEGKGYLTSVPSEYITEEELEGKGYLTEHQSLAHLATKSELEGKVDKVIGKQLSTEDFTTLLKSKLESLKNYDDTELVSRIDAIQETIDTLFSKDASSAIESFNEIIAFLEGVEDSENLDSIIASIEQQIADVAKAIPSKVSELENDKGYLTEHQDVSHLATRGELTSGLATKQDTIADLDTIRSGAAKGATALQSYTEKYTGTYSKPSNGIPKSDLDSSVQTSLGKADTALQSYTEQYKGTVTGVKINGGTKSPSNGIIDLGTVITAHQDISGKMDKSNVVLYKANWIATQTTGISQQYTEVITVPAGTYILSVVLPYAKVGHGNQICIGFSASVAIGKGNTFLDASYGATTMLAVFTKSTSLCVVSAASNNSAEWDYLDRGGLAALRII